MTLGRNPKQPFVLFEGWNIDGSTWEMRCTQLASPKPCFFRKKMRKAGSYGLKKSMILPRLLEAERLRQEEEAEATVFFFHLTKHCLLWQKCCGTIFCTVLRWLYIIYNACVYTYMYIYEYMNKVLWENTNGENFGSLARIFIRRVWQKRSVWQRRHVWPRRLRKKVPGRKLRAVFLPETSIAPGFSRKWPKWNSKI